MEGPATVDLEFWYERGLEQVCPCGLSGNNCTDLVRPLRNPDAALTQLCNAAGFDSCYVTKTDAICRCKCGYSGDLCESRNIPLQQNYFFGAIFLPLLSLLLLGRFFYKHGWFCRRHEDDRYTLQEVASSHFSWAGPRTLLLFRLFGFLIVWPLLIRYAVVLGQQYEVFSIWSWFLLGTFLFSASLASILEMNHCKVLEVELAMVTRFLFIVEFPSAVFIAACIWLVFLPSSYSTGSQSTVLTIGGFFFHAANVVLCLVEFALNKYFLHSTDAVAFYLFGLVYAQFHLYDMLWKDRHGFDHCPLYFPLDLSNKLYPFFLLLLLLAAAAVFYLLLLLSNLKKRYFEERGRKRTKELSLTKIAIKL